MVWNRKKRIQGKNQYYSVSKKFLRENKTNSEFEVILNSLTLEEIIALKLELSIQTINNKLYNFPLWQSMPNITRDALLRYAMSACQSKRDMARF